MDARPEADALSPPTHTGRSALFAAVVAAALSAVSYAWFGTTHLTLADEGYLWYGVLRVLEGEVPFRDFQAYDPGRYYWCAAFAPLAGSGILGVRVATAAFQAVGLFFGILTARRLARGRAWPLWTALFALTLALWMFPRHKLFEPAIALAITWSLVRLVERPSARRHLACGLVIGLAGWFGRNHALYGTLAALSACALSWWKRREPGAWRGLLSLVAGLALGYAPLWSMLLAVPGFADAFFREIASIADKGTNVPHPYPWPWRFEPEGAAGMDLAGALARHAAFTLLPLGLATGLWATLRTRGDRLASHAVIVGGTLAGLFYAHHVAVRSDPPHLAQCIHPVLLVVLALPAALGWPAVARAATWCGLAALSLLAAFVTHNSLRWVAPWRPPPRYVEHVVAGDTLRLLPETAVYLANVEAAIAREVPPAEPLLIVPARPTLYCVLGRRAPIHQIYFLWKATEEAQLDLIREIDEAGIPWVLVVDTAVDDRDELRFAKTHPLVQRLLRMRFQRVPTPRLPLNHRLFRRST